MTPSPHPGQGAYTGALWDPLAKIAPGQVAGNSNLKFGVRPRPAGPYTTARRLAGRTRPEIKQVHRLSESPEQIAAVDREVAARAAP